MKKFYSYFVATILCFIISSSLVAQTKQDIIDRLITTYHENNRFNGVVLVMEKGEVVLKKAYGMANMEWDVSLTTDAKFRIGSVTKQFTAAIILKLVEEGKIKLTGKLSDYLPYYRKDNGDKITIHHLLNHSSGIPNYTALPGMFTKTGMYPHEAEEFVKNYCSGDLEFEPGTQFRYNNSAYYILGVIIERITEKSYSDNLCEIILKPLEMNNSGAGCNYMLLKKRTAGYARAFKRYDNSLYTQPSVTFSAGNMYSTVDDFYKWYKGLTAYKVLSKETTEKMFTPNIKDGAWHYGYGFSLRSFHTEGMEDTLSVIQHGGDIFGFSSLIYWTRENDQFIALLNNFMGFPRTEITNNIMKILNGSEADMVAKEISYELNDIIDRDGIGTAIEKYYELKKEDTGKYIFSEAALNALGYYLMNNNKLDESLEIFKLNVKEYPKSGNVYDSMAEALLNNGNKAEAIKNYKKAYELNPANKNAADFLKENGIELSEDIKLKSDELKEYIGKYQLAAGVIFTISEKESHLFAQLTGQRELEIFCKEKDKFYYKEVNAQLQFNRNKTGEIISCTLLQNNRETECNKVY